MSSAREAHAAHELPEARVRAQAVERREAGEHEEGVPVLIRGFQTLEDSPALAKAVLGRTAP
jgi:hypothetical protein